MKNIELLLEIFFVQFLVTYEHSLKRLGLFYCFEIMTIFTDSNAEDELAF